MCGVRHYIRKAFNRLVMMGSLSPPHPLVILSGSWLLTEEMKVQSAPTSGTTEPPCYSKYTLKMIKGDKVNQLNECSCTHNHILHSIHRVSPVDSV